jgi:FkbM family methyltransferase
MNPLGISIILLAVALVAVVAVSERRHARVRRRLRRFERAETDLLRLRRLVYADRATAALSRAGRTPLYPMEFPSQFGEDMLLWDLFDGQTTGFFIEVGAHDGYSDAVTYPFEAAGWTGLLVEPMPDRYAACAARRTHSQVVHAALSRRGSKGTATLEIMSAGEGDPQVAHLSSKELTGVYTKQYTHKAGRVEVPLTTMDDVLGSHSGPIDFAVIDVEGAELDLLDGFDLDRRCVRVILIEDLHMGREDAILKYLEARGYEQVCWFAYNRLCIRREESRLIARAKDLASRVPFPSRAGE